jgi:membrane protein implicated in regulation of membrane protease activity
MKEKHLPTAFFLTVLARIAAGMLVMQGHSVFASYTIAFTVCIVVLIWLIHRERTALLPQSDELRELKSTLFGMVGGERSTAYALVDYERVRHPGQSEEWYWHSAIKTLEWDRRRWD